MRIASIRLLLAVILAAIFSSAGVHAAGFQRGVAADPDGKPLEVGIWYPSQDAPRPLTVGLTTMNVAVNAPVQSGNLPLVVMSHGNGGFFLSHFDTAIALADAGFVVAAVTHTGDNFADRSRSANVMDRPRHISRVIDHMLSTWEGHSLIDSSRIGMFGFSSGGFTTLASIGGMPDFSKIGPMCGEHPGDYACQLIAKGGDSFKAPPQSATNAADPRVKAAVVVAPALGFVFGRAGLKNVKVPVQLWRGENDVVVPHPRYAEAVRIALPQAPDYHVIANAGHFDFMAPCSGALASVAPTICTSAPGFDRVAFHSSFNDAVIKFFSEAGLAMQCSLGACLRDATAIP